MALGSSASLAAATLAGTDGTAAVTTPSCTRSCKASDGNSAFCDGGELELNTDGQEQLQQQQLQVFMHKSLIFSSAELECAFRLHSARRHTPGDLWLAGLQVCGWLCGTAARLLLPGRDDRARTAVGYLLLCVLPSLAHLLLILCRPAAYRRHREVAGMLLRAPHDTWVILLPQKFVSGFLSPSTGLTVLGVHLTLLRHLRLLACASYHLAFVPLLSRQAFLSHFYYNTAQLALWLACAHRHAGGGAWKGPNGVDSGLGAALLLAYALPLALLYWEEAEQRTRFALARVPGIDPQRLRLRVAADWPLAPLNFLVPAGLLVWSACIQVLG